MEDRNKRMRELIDLLNEASVQYYQYSTPIMTDYEYDKLYDELVELENETKITYEDSPTINIEHEISQTLEKVEHAKPMLSLAKTKSISDLESFVGDKEALLSWKLDGLTIVLTYKNGKLISGVTRGNGTIGEVVTKNVKEFKNIPLTIPFKGDLIVRGEAVIKYSDFNKMNEELDEDSQYKNPRNLCSGSVRQLDSKITAKRNVNIIIFSLVDCSEKISNSKNEQFNWLDTLGFETVERVIVNKNNIEEEVLKYKDKIIDYDIPSDGLVLTFDDIEYGLSLGMTNKFPKHSIAFKWKDETVKTKLLNIDWQTSRTGLINPVAVFEPVEIEGTTVSRASLHNVSILKNLKLGIGDTIEVYKANMIIPQVANNLTCKDDYEIPKTCNVCNHEAKIVSNDNVSYLYCTNDYCKAKLIKRLSLFTTRNAMNIDGISDQILTKLINENLLNEFSDLYKLENHKEKILSFEGFKEKSYNNMINSINKSRNVKIANFIYALGIKDIGLSRAKLICSSCNNDIEKVRNISFEELSNIDGVGEIIALNWINTFKDESFINEFNNLLKEIEFIKEETKTLKLENLTFVITGGINNFKNRDEMVEYIESFGGKTVSSVSAKLNYLINNDINSTSSKNKKAKELGIKIITEEELIEMTK